MDEGVEAVIRAVDPAVREPLWSLRRAGMPLLYGMKGDRKPITFVEDTAVAPARLAEYAARFRDILRRHSRPDIATVQHELSGQICRCTGYANIVKAIVAAGQEMARVETSEE